MRRIVPLASLFFVMVAQIGAQSNVLRRFPEESTDLLSPRGDRTLHWAAPKGKHDIHSIHLIDEKTRVSEWLSDSG